MRILTVLKRYNKLFAFIAFLTIVAIYLVISLSGNYLKERIYHDENTRQPVNSIKSIIQEIKDDNNDDNKDNDKDKDKVKDNDNNNEYFSYEFNENKEMGDYIYLINQFPISDEVGKQLEGKYKTYNFRLKFNEAAAGSKYNITLERLAESDLYNDWVKVYLLNEGNEISNCIRENGRIKTYNEFERYNSKDNEVLLYSGTISPLEAKRGYKDYTLRMWISEDVKVVNEDYEKRSFIARVNVYATSKN